METITSHNANGASVAYTYDDLNRLSTVVDNNLPGQNTTSYTYDNASNVATVATPNGLQSSFTYDTLNQLTSETSSLLPSGWPASPKPLRASVPIYRCSLN